MSAFPLLACWPFLSQLAVGGDGVRVCVLGSRCLLPNLAADPCLSQTVVVAVAAWLASLSSVVLGDMAFLLPSAVRLFAVDCLALAVVCCAGYVCLFSVVASFLAWNFGCCSSTVLLAASLAQAVFHCVPQNVGCSTCLVEISSLVAFLVGPCVW